MKAFFNYMKAPSEAAVQTNLGALFFSGQSFMVTGVDQFVTAFTLALSMATP